VAQALSLLDFLRGLQTDEAFRSAFTADPGATLTEHGLGDLSPYDVHDALVLMEDTETAEFSHDITGAAAHMTPPPPNGSSDAHRYLSAYLASTSSEADAPAVDDWDAEHPDPEADLEPPLASDGADGGGYGVGDDVIGFGDGAGTLPGSADPVTDLDPAYGIDATDRPPADDDFDSSELDDVGSLFSATPDDAELPGPDPDRFAEPDHAGEHHAPMD
jgi:hypothetical protein